MTPHRYMILANLAVAFSVSLAVFIVALILMGMVAYFIFKTNMGADGHGRGFRIREISEPESRTEGRLQDESVENFRSANRA